MNEDLQNKINRLRGLLSAQSQMTTEVPAAPVPPMGDMDTMQDIMSGEPMLDDSGEAMRPACIRRLIENDGKMTPNTCPPPSQDGCCCDGGVPTGMTMESECDGVWQGAGVSCSPNPCGGMSMEVPSIKEIFHKGLEALKQEFAQRENDKMMG